MSVQSDRKTGRGGPNLFLLDVPGMQDREGEQGLQEALELIGLGAVNHVVQVNDCEAAADYTESDNGVLDVTESATGKKIGTNNILLTNTAATDNSQYVETLLIDESASISLGSGNPLAQQSWLDTRFLGFWIHAGTSGDFGTLGEMKVAIVGNGGVVSSKVDIPATVVDSHDYFQVDMVTEGWDRTRVEGLRFYGNNSNAAEVLHIDDVQRYRLSNGIGPFMGSAFPITNGTTLTAGRIAAWSIDGLVEEGAPAVETLGTVIFPKFEATLTGDAQRSKYGIIPGVSLQLVRANLATVAGEGLEWQTTTRVEGVATGVEEFGFLKGLEAAGEAGDVIWAVARHGVFIS